MWTISVLSAWIAAGFGEVGGVLHTSPLDRPDWARSPSLAMLALMTLLWPLITILASPFTLQSTTRGVAHGLMSAGIRFCVAALMIFAGLLFAFHVADTTFGRTAVLIAELVSLPITLLLYGIVVGIVGLPVIMVVMGLLNLLLPVKRGS
jgi:hypothetical protein